MKGIRPGGGRLTCLISREVFIFFRHFQLIGLLLFFSANFLFFSFLFRFSNFLLATVFFFFSCPVLISCLDTNVGMLGMG